MYISVFWLWVIALAFIATLCSYVSYVKRSKYNYCIIYRKFGFMRWKFERLAHLYLLDKCAIIDVTTDEQKEVIAKSFHGHWITRDGWMDWDTSNLCTKGHSLIMREFKHHYIEYDYRDVDSDLCSAGYQPYSVLNSK